MATIGNLLFPMVFSRYNKGTAGAFGESEWVSFWDVVVYVRVRLHPNTSTLGTKTAPMSLHHQSRGGKARPLCATQVVDPAAMVMVNAVVKES